MLRKRLEVSCGQKPTEASWYVGEQGPVHDLPSARHTCLDEGGFFLSDSTEGKDNPTTGEMTMPAGLSLRLL